MEESFSNAFIRECIRELKKENRCYCYFEWQIQEIKRYVKNIEVKKRDGYYLLKAI